MKLTDFLFEFPLELVAQEAIEPRDASRMMLLDRSRQEIDHSLFKKFPDYFQKGDLLILNNTKVLPARLWAKKKTGGKIEVLLLREEGKVWECLLKNVRGLENGDEIFFEFEEQKIPARYFVKDEKRFLEFPAKFSVKDLMRDQGAAPLPPYIRREAPRAEDLQRYQSVFAKKEGAIAAPTASLHFTEEVFEALKSKGVEIHFITLHVGMGTFEPIRAENIEEHQMQTEYYEIAPEVVEAIQKAKQEGRPVTAVGTTVVRSLESYFKNPPNPPLTKGGEGGFNSTHLFITPGYPFKIIDRFLTNFHQPCSTPLLLTSAFAGKDFLFRAYQEAIERKYRLFSYGDCMLIT